MFKATVRSKQEAHEARSKKQEANRIFAHETNDVFVLLYVRSNHTKKKKHVRLLLMPKRPFSTNNKFIEVAYPLQLKIGHLLNQFSAEQEHMINYDSSSESFDTEETFDIIMPSSIPFKFDFDINKIETLTMKKKTTVGNDIETVEVKLPLMGPS